MYSADKTRASKTVSYISDLDTISFEISPLDKFDFLVLLNGKDSCLQRVESGINFQVDESKPLVSDTIPFFLTKFNNIVIQAVLNESDTVDLMFHTAAGFTIGSHPFDTIPIGFFAGAIGQQRMSVIGGDVLERFDWGIDLQSGVIHLRPNGLQELPCWDP